MTGRDVLCLCALRLSIRLTRWPNYNQLIRWNATAGRVLLVRRRKRARRSRSTSRNPPQNFPNVGKVIHSGLMNITIRPETVADIAAISAVTEAAFLTCPYSRQTEQFIVHALRKAVALTVSLVAEVDGNFRRPCCLLAGENFRWQFRLVRTRPRFRSAGTPAAGNRQSAHPRRTRPAQSGECERLYARWRSRLLQTLRLPEFSGTDS